MKKFWEKYKGLILVLVAVCAFVALSFLREGKEPEAIDIQFASNIDEWANDVVSDKNVVTVIALSYCDHCKNYKPVLQEIAIANDLTVYWFEADKIEEESYNALTSTVNFDEYNGSSPYTAITNSGVVLAQTTGYASKDASYSFFRENGLINE